VLVSDFVVDFFHTLDSTWGHESVMPAIVHIFKPVLFELLNFIPPSEENWFVIVLASLVVAGSDLQNSFVFQLTNEPSNLSELLIWLLDHSNLKSLFLSLQYPGNELYLLRPNLPIASEALLNRSNPKSCLNDIFLDLRSHLSALQQIYNQSLGRIISQMH